MAPASWFACATRPSRSFLSSSMVIRCPSSVFVLCPQGRRGCCLRACYCSSPCRFLIRTLVCVSDLAPHVHLERSHNSGSRCSRSQSEQITCACKRLLLDSSTRSRKQELLHQLHIRCYACSAGVKWHCQASD